MAETFIEKQPDGKWVVLKRIAARQRGRLVLGLHPGIHIKSAVTVEDGTATMLLFYPNDVDGETKRIASFDENKKLSVLACGVPTKLAVTVQMPADVAAKIVKSQNRV